MSRLVVAGESPPSDGATQRHHQPLMSSTTHSGPTEQHNSNPATATPRGGNSTANQEGRDHITNDPPDMLAPGPRHKPGQW